MLSNASGVMCDCSMVNITMCDIVLIIASIYDTDAVKIRV